MIKEETACVAVVEKGNLIIGGTHYSSEAR
jgi:hypothetical protein